MCALKVLYFASLLSVYAVGTTPNSEATVLLDFREGNCVTNGILLEDEPARLRIISKYHISFILYKHQELERNDVSIPDSGYKEFLCNLEDKSPGLKNYTLLIQRNISQPNTVWYGRDFFKPIYCNVTIHLRLKQSPVTVAINNAELKTARTNMSVTNFDAVAYHKFKEGELVDISCGKHDENGSLLLRYGNLETRADKAIRTKYKQLRLQIKMSAQDTMKYATCRIIMERDNAIVRVYFIHEKEKEDDLTIRVNGLKLRRQLSDDDDEVLNFSYKLQHSESAEVLCEKREGLSGALTFDPSYLMGRRSNLLPITSDNSTTVSIQMSTDDFNLKCKYKDETKEIIAEIDFVYDDMLDFDILGVPADNIKYKYMDPKNHQIHSEIEYSGGDKLNLTCAKVTNSVPMVFILYWNMTDDDNINMKDGALISKESSSISHTYALDSAGSDKVLKCLVYERTMGRNEIKQEILYVTIVIKLTARSTQIITEKPPEPTTTEATIINRPGDSGKLVLVAIIIGFCILVLIMLLIVYSIGKHKPQKKRDSNIYYENLPESLNSDNLPTPAQWNDDHYARPIDLREDTETYSVPYIATNKEELYAKPQPKSLRNKTKNKDNHANLEPMYSEIGAFNVKDSNDPNYAQVVPKNKRNNLKPVNKNPYSNVLPKNEGKNYVLPLHGNYAEIATEALKKSDKTSYVNINKESNYAEVVHMINDRNKYVNVVPNDEPYVNATSSDYAEPAYCELNLKNNNKKSKGQNNK